MTSDGPCHPWRMEIPAAPALAIIMGTSRGETRRAPFSLYTTTCSARVSKPPTPVAKMTPALAGSASISPASFTAMSAAAMLNWAKRSSWRASLLPNHCSGSKSGTSPPTTDGVSRPSQSASTPRPQQVTAPSPVIATAPRGWGRPTQPSCIRVAVDQIKA